MTSASASRVSVDRARFDQTHGRALHGAGDADFVAALRQDDVIETGAGEQRACHRQAEVHGDRHHFIVFVILADDLPHVRAGGDLKSADITPAKVHAVITEIGAAVKILAGDQTIAGTDGQFGFDVGMTDRHDEVVCFRRFLINFFLHRRIFLIDDDGRDRMGDGVGEFSGAIGVIFPAEHLVDDVHVAEQIGDTAMLRFAFDVIKKDRAAAVELFLNAGEFQVGVDLFVGDNDVPFFFHPLDRTA